MIVKKGWLYHCYYKIIDESIKRLKHSPVVFNLLTMVSPVHSTREGKILQNILEIKRLRVGTGITEIR